MAKLESQRWYMKPVGDMFKKDGIWHQKFELNIYWRIYQVLKFRLFKIFKKNYGIDIAVKYNLEDTKYVIDYMPPIDCRGKFIDSGSSLDNKLQSYDNIPIIEIEEEMIEK